MKVNYSDGDVVLRLGKIQVRWEVRYEQDRSKIKEEYSNRDGALRSVKIQVRPELDTSKIEVR